MTNRRYPTQTEKRKPLVGVRLESEDLNFIEDLADQMRIGHSTLAKIILAKGIKRLRDGEPLL